ncbi:MAG: tetratricopeptide repeat protein [Nitrospirota bacterium]
MAALRPIIAALAAFAGLAACLAPAPYRLGNRALERGDYAEAIRQYQQALADDPADPAARNNLGVAYLRADQDELAFQEFQKILVRRPADAKAQFNLGLVYYKKGLFDLELEAYRKTIELDPGHFEAHLHLGHAALAKGLDDDAMQQYRWVLDKHPAHPSALYNLSLLHEDRGELREALALLERYLKLNYSSRWTLEAQRRADALRARLAASP